MTEAKYEELVGALTNAGVALRDLNGEYRSTYDIMADLAAKWSELTDMQKAALATNIAGTRQQNVLYSIIESFGEASGAMKEMEGSAGELEKAYGTYLDSIEGRTAQLKATFETLSQALFNSDLIKGAIGKLNSILTIFEKVVTFGDGIALKVTASVAAWKLLIAILPSVISWFGKLTVAQFAATASQEGFRIALAKTSTTGIAGMILAIPKLIYAIHMYRSSAKVATAESMSFAAALEAVQLSATQVVGVIAAVAAILGYVFYKIAKNNSLETAVERLDEASNSLQETIGKIEQLNSELQTTRSRIRELLSQESLTLVEQDELGRLQQTNIELQQRIELERQLRTERAKSLDNSFATAVSKAKTEPYNNADLYVEWIEEYKQILVGATGKEAEQARNELASVESGYAEIIEQLDEYKEKVADIPYDQLSEKAKEAYDYIIAKEAEFADYTSGRAAAADAFFSSKKFADARTQFSQLVNKAKDDKAEFDALFEDSEEELQELFYGTGKWRGDSAFSRIFSTDDLYAFAKVLGTDVGTAYSTLKQAAKEWYEQQTSGELDSVESVDEITTKFEELKTSLDSARSAFSTVTAAIKEFNENGVLSSDTLSKLLALEPEYLNLLVDEEGQLNLTSESYEKLIKAKLQNMLLNQMDSTIKTIMNMTAERAAAHASAEAYDTETESIYGLIAAKMKLALADAKDKDAANNTDVFSKAVLRMGTMFKPLVASIENYSLASENASSSTSKSTSSTDANTESLKKQKEALEDSKKALEDYKSELTDAQSNIKALTDLVQEYIKAQKDEEKKALQERKENFDDLISKEKEELQVKKEAAEFEKTLRDKQNSYAKNALAASIASLDNSSAGRKAQKEANDALVSSRDDLYDTLADHEYDIRVKALDELQKKNDEYYDNQIEKIDEYLSDTRQVYEDACRMIENDTGDLYGKLWEYTYQHTTKTKAEFDKMWSDAQTALERYGVAQNGVIGIMEILQGEIYNTESQINNVSGAIDTLNTKINNAANDGLSNLSAKISDVSDEYERLMQAMQEEANKKWHFSYGGIDYWSSATDFDTAASQIWNEVYKRTKLDINRGYIMGGMHYYANGTNSAPGGLAVVGERGAELEVMNRGNGVLTNKITRGLAALGSNPAQFIADASAKLLESMRQTNRALVPAVAGVSGNQSVPINFSYVINGDVNPQTLRELKKYHQQTVNDAVKEMMSRSLMLRNTTRVR